MARRSILVGLALLANTPVSAGTPGAPGQTPAPGEAPDRPPAPPGSLEDSLRAASRVGKPLLVVVVPDRGVAGRSAERDDFLARRELLGQLVFEADDEAAALLALCHIGLAQAGEVAPLLGGQVGKPPPLLVLVETDVLVPTASAMPAPDRLEALFQSDVRGNKRPASEDEAVAARLKALTPGLRTLIAGSAATRERRRRQAEAVLPPERIATVLGALETSPGPKPEEVDAVAGALAPLPGETAGKALAAAWRARVSRGAVPGTGGMWEDRCPSCGLAVISRRAREMLDLWPGSSRGWNTREPHDRGDGLW